MNPSQVSDTPTTPTGTTTTGSATASMAGMRQGLKDTARDAAAQLKSAASTTATRAREEAERLASEKKTTAADRIGGYSSAIHESARSLEEQDPNIAWFTHRAADRLQGVADYVRNRNFSEFRHDAEDVARRHPALFFGGLFVAGLLLGNVLKSSRRPLSERSSSEPDDDVSDWAATSSTSPGGTDPVPSSGI